MVESDKYGCAYIRNEKNTAGAFREAMKEGVNLCDSCPYHDCIASQKQVTAMHAAEHKYWKEHLTAAEKRTLKAEEQLRKNELARKKHAEEESYGKRRGRPRKEIDEW